MKKKGLLVAHRWNMFTTAALTRVQSPRDTYRPKKRRSLKIPNVFINEKIVYP